MEFDKEVMFRELGQSHSTAHLFAYMSCGAGMALSAAHWTEKRVWVQSLARGEFGGYLRSSLLPNLQWLTRTEWRLFLKSPMHQNSCPWILVLEVSSLKIDIPVLDAGRLNHPRASYISLKLHQFEFPASSTHHLPLQGSITFMLDSFF